METTVIERQAFANWVMYFFLKVKTKYSYRILNNSITNKNINKTKTSTSVMILFISTTAM